MKTIKTIGALALSAFAGCVLAAATPEDVAKLGVSLTPIGAEKAGNAAGTIPEWTGGLPRDAAPIRSNGFLGNPFADEKPLFTITAANKEDYQEHLTEGQKAMFARYPDSFRMHVYPTHRSAALPEEIYAAVRTSAKNVTLVEGGNGLKGFAESRYYAFPIPRNGLEVVWNHITRYRGGQSDTQHSQRLPATQWQLHTGSYH